MLPSAEVVAAVRDRMNAAFGLREWPKTYAVSREEYAAVEDHLKAFHDERIRQWREAGEIGECPWGMFVGPHFGVMFKGVELLVA